VFYNMFQPTWPSSFNNCVWNVWEEISNINYYKRKVSFFNFFNFITFLYGCETWLLILREEYRLRVFESRVLTRIFGPKRVKVTREWR
jgi:hypothetical protein